MTDIINQAEFPSINLVQLVLETSGVHASAIQAYHGERITFRADYRDYGRRVMLYDTGDYAATATLYWRTGSDAEGYWHETPGWIEDGYAWAVFGPEQDAGEDEVAWFLRVTADGDNCYKAAGTLRLYASPGFTPAVLPPARAVLDFAVLDVLNAPYYTQAETNAAIGTAVAGLVPETREINGHTLSADVTLTGADIEVGGESQYATAPIGVAFADVDQRLEVFQGAGFESWTFEVDDGQGGTETVTRRVFVGPAQTVQTAEATQTAQEGI